jgi:SAM-dependent methyltransferase
MLKESYPPSGQRKPPFTPHFNRYLSTNRRLEEVKTYYPPGTVDPDSWGGQKILDIGCGKFGYFVRQLRGHGVEAYGIDKNLQTLSDEAPYLFQGDLRAMPFADEQFDRIFATHTVFSSFYEGKNPVFMRESLEEVMRVLKPGGFIDMSGHTAIRNILDVIRNNPHLQRLKMVRAAKVKVPGSQQKFLELQKQ